MDTDIEAERDENDGDAFVLRTKYTVKVNEVVTTVSSEEPRDLSASTEGSDDDEASLIADISFEFAALFTVERREDDSPVTDEELRAYSFTTGVFAMYPYAREYIYDTTGRVGLPPLTVGVLQLPVKRPVATA
ncbi:hypothetical protein [Actinoplanes auranticolor]|nr:hypothetical protein [Actinoplanes auranticolor]